MEPFTMIDGLTISIFSMAVVFVILVLLAVVLTGFSSVLSKFDEPDETPSPNLPVAFEDDDDESMLVAKIIASCLIQGEHGKNVRIRSIRRIK